MSRNQEQPRRWRLRQRHRPSSPRPACLPLVLGRARLLWRVDRQPDRAGAVSADLHRRSAHRCSSPGAASSDQPMPASPATFAPCPKCGLPTKVIFWIVAALVLVALAFPLRPAAVLLKGDHHEETHHPHHPHRLAAALSAPAYRLPPDKSPCRCLMTCAACPITVKTALSVAGVEGRSPASRREAVVSTGQDQCRRLTRPPQTRVTRQRQAVRA